MKGQRLDRWYAETGMKTRNYCFHNNELFYCVYIFRFIWWKFLFIQVTYFLSFQRSSTMSSTTSNDVINVKHNWGCCFFMFHICFLARKIDMWTFSTSPKYTFPAWKFMILMSISTHCHIFRIRCFGINMTPMCLYSFWSWTSTLEMCIAVMCWMSTYQSSWPRNK